MPIYLGVGSNVGDRLKNLNDVIANFVVLKRSSVFETEPVGFLDQPWFLNAVIHIDSQLSPRELLEFCQEIENRMGRKRDIPKGPRTIDIDLLFYDEVVLTAPQLILPHPQIPNRRFVLEPMSQIAPDFVHPVLKKTIRELLSATDDFSVVRKI